MKKRETTFPLTPHEKRDVEQARATLAKALNDAGAGHVVPMLKIDFVKTRPVTESAATFVMTISTEDKTSDDRLDPAVQALFSAVAHGRGRLANLELEDDPVRLRHEFSGCIDLHMPKVAQVLRHVRVPKASI